jgi:hypothetical protein
VSVAPPTATVSPTRPSSGRSVLRRPAVAGLLLVVVYLAIAALGDVDAGLGSDSGGKLATAKVMADGGELTDPDVGYWAADADPEGRFHPLVNTMPVGDRWVQAKSLPYSTITARLWPLADAWGPVLLSIAGGLATAFAARRMARHLGGDPDLAFWLVGLASPVAVYAADAWEHAPALGLATWGVAFAIEAAGHRQAAAAGLLLGGAVVLRADMGATVVALAAAIVLVPELRRRWTRPLSVALVGGAAGACVLVANALLERSVLASGVRDVRAGNGAVAAGSELGTRATDAVLTAFGLFADDTASGLFIAVLLAIGLGVLVLGLRGSSTVTPAILRATTFFVVGLYLVRLLDGWSFVPGALAVAPVAVLAVVAPRLPESKALLVTALGAVPLVWTFQWKGNHLAQWGARYLLVSTVLLLVLAAVTLSGPVGRQTTARVLLALTVLAGVAGIGWHIRRTDVVAGIGDQVAALPVADDAIVVSTQQHLGRELGSRYGEHRWLSADAGTLAEALGIAADAAPSSIVVIAPTVNGQAPDDVPDVAGYHPSGSSSIDALGGALEVDVLARD